MRPTVPEVPGVRDTEIHLLTDSIRQQTHAMSHHRIGFLGAGKMATALARGLVQAGFTTADKVVASDVSTQAREAFARATGCAVADSNLEVLNQSEVVILAVKPQVVDSVLDEIAPAGGDTHLFISIAAGVDLARLHHRLGSDRRIVRVMPNTPALVGAGAAGFACGPGASGEDARLVQQLLNTVGIAVQVPEHLLDAVTGLSGSGPAYVFQIIEALSDGGVRVGLPRQVATQLAAQTVLGTAKMVLETGEHPAALKDAVASPGGTTIAGLHELERGGLRGIIMDAVQVAAERSRELGSS